MVKSQADDVIDESASHGGFFEHLRINGALRLLFFGPACHWAGSWQS